MKRALLLLTFLAGAASAEPPDSPQFVSAKVNEPVTFKVKVPTGQKAGWQAAFVTQQCFIARLYSDDPQTMEFMAIPKVPGNFGCVFWTIGDSTGKTTLIGSLGPIPPGPDPGPGPGPGPTPDPTPPDGTSPFKDPGLRCLIVFEKDKLGELTPKQYSALYSNTWRAYMAENGAKNAQGVVEYRVWDQNAPMGADTPANFKELMAKPRASVPWVYVGNGKSGYEGPTPPDADGMLKLLQKYGAK